MDAPGAQNNVENVIRGRANYGKWKFFWTPSALRCATPLTLGISCNAGASHQGRCALVCSDTTKERPGASTPRRDARRDWSLSVPKNHATTLTADKCAA